MANQPKKYKKFVATAATATLVASAIVPVASAASFSDVVVGGSHSEAINALADQGIIKGYADGTFKPGVQINRGQTVKLLGRWLESQGYEIPADWNSVQRFSDVPVNAADQELVKYAALVKDAGVFNGSQGKLNASQPMQRQHMAVVLVRAIKNVLGEDLVQQYKDAGFVSSIEDLDQAYANENREAIIALEYAGITKVSDGNFRPTQTVTRGQFASFLYRTINLEVVNAEVEAIEAINNTTVEVTFKDKVVDVKSLDFEIDGLAVKNAAVKQTDDKTVVLTTAAQEGGKKYAVTLNGKKVGTFVGISAVIPTSIKLITTNTQAKVGNEVTLKADIGVKEAGVPVTFNIDAPAGSINKDQVVEVYTNADGIAEFTYTQYSPEADDVTVYPTGAPQLRSFGTVYWGVDNILTLQEVNEGNVLANGTKKTYKVTFKDPKTGKPLSGQDINVSFVENTNVPFNAISKATVTNPATGVTVTPYQTTTGLVQEITVKTDAKGEATFIVSGTNTSVTPYVFVDGTSSVWYRQNVNGTNYISTTSKNSKWEATELTATAATVKFEGAQLNHQITVERNGDEEAAAEYVGVRKNGREYTVTVKDKEGKPYAGGVVNVAFDELIDKNLTTHTTAKLDNVKDSTALFNLNADRNQGQLKLDSNGQAKFLVYGADDVSATPVVWIDQNYSQNYQTGVLEEGEPFAKGAVVNFQYERVIGGELSVNNKTITDNSAAVYSFALTNQSGKELDNLVGKITYEIRNTGSNDIYVTLPNATYKDQNNQVVFANHRIAVGGSLVVTADVTSKSQTRLEVTSNGQNAAVDVKASFVTANGFDASYDNGSVTDPRDFNKYVATDYVKATFVNSSIVTAPYTGELDLTSINKTDKTFKFAGKTNAIKYAGETGKTYKYFGIGNTPVASADAFIALLEQARAEGKAVVVTYEVSSDNVVTFTIVAERQVSTANKTALKASLDAEKAVVEAGNTGYTEESWNAYVAAYNKALEVFNNVYATQAQVDAAKAALDAAKAGLKSAAQYTVEFTTADAIAPNDIAKLLKVFESYVVEGTVAEEGVTSIELTFTDVDENTITKTVSVVDGKFQATFTLNDFDKHVKSVSYGNKTKNFEEKVK
ncbi:S-layer homology domain-containing protein [Ureibacillus thermophilus]|uniref:S-layer homology domain-containing protein n=1 Tax=Ureibacillus thermophilus TaxID=367743 RepID=UPI0036140307